ncbi:hypothetical protein HGRIS_007350 [Hohenbuehelia grisea]|uniref:Mediator of RNA polymerase II transcription subunit 21 n=1 Tax=Hohenbuehelia grisea TaxID=104357 RepID=A0ABR3J4W4_9AGAR
MLQELSYMDRITQLQDEIQQIIVIMNTGLQNSVHRANLIQVNPDVPITKHRKPGLFDTPEEQEANRKEMVRDLVVKAKQIEYLINSLPEPEAEHEQAKRLADLEREMEVANAEYILAFNRAKELHRQISETLRLMLDGNDIDVLSDSAG